GLVRLRYTKNKRRHVVPMPQLTRMILAQWHSNQLPTSPLVFPSRDGLRPASIGRAWAVACARAQLEDFRFHDLRHTAASYLAMAGVRIEDIAAILGHRSIETTRRYRHLLPSYLGGLVEQMTQQFIKP